MVLSSYTIIFPVAEDGPRNDVLATCLTLVSFTRQACHDHDHEERTLYRLEGGGGEGGGGGRGEGRGAWFTKEVFRPVKYSKVAKAVLQKVEVNMPPSPRVPTAL